MIADVIGVVALGVLVVAVLVVLVVRAGRRGASPDSSRLVPPPPPSSAPAAAWARAVGAPVPASQGGALPLSSPRATAAASPRSDPAVVDLFDDDPEDGLDVTQVFASPASGKPMVLPAMDIAIEESPPESEPEQRRTVEASNVDVFYEDDAEVDEPTLPHARFLVYAAGQSDIGRVRKRNEDSFLALPEQSLFVVADGMGGYAGGQVASRLAVFTIGTAFERQVFLGKLDREVPKPGAELALSVQMANQAILELARKNEKLSRMGTTVVAARFSANKQRVYIAHVGDSRCYRLRGDELTQLTSDHTMAAMGAVGPRALDLVRAVGVEDELKIDVIVDKPHVGDLYMLCSDGVFKMAPIAEVAEMLDESDLKGSARAIIDHANARGGRDNITVILVSVRVGTHKSSRPPPPR